MKSTRHSNSNLFKAISWLFMGMTALFALAAALVTAINFAVQILFHHNPSKLAKPRS